MKFVIVAAGGAIGAVLRYAISLIPNKSSFPILTLITNILGAFFIGLIAAYASKHTDVNPNTILLLKTGVCGAFTTFSTFSLEALTLYQNRHPGLAVLYMALSLILCLAAVFAGENILLR